MSLADFSDSENDYHVLTCKNKLMPIPEGVVCLDVLVKLHSLKHIKFPASLRKLTFFRTLFTPIDAGDILDTVTELSLPDDYDFPLSPGVIPKCAETLVLGSIGFW